MRKTKNKMHWPTVLQINLLNYWKNFYVIFNFSPNIDQNRIYTEINSWLISLYYQEWTSSLG